MSEAIPQPQEDAEIAAMAADLAKRRRRLQLLNLAILLLPLAAGALFLAFGRDDREWVRKEVDQNVHSSVADCPASISVGVTLNVSMRTTGI